MTHADAIRQHVRSFGQSDFTTADVTACGRWPASIVQSTVKRMRKEGRIIDVGKVDDVKNALRYRNVAHPSDKPAWQFNELLACFGGHP